MKGCYPATIVLFFCVFGAGIFVLAPASLLNLWLERASAGTFLLANADGTVWSGSGDLLLKSDTHFVSFGAYAWKIQPARMLSGALQFDVWQGDTGNPMGVRFSPFKRELGLIGLRAVLPAQILEIFSPKLRAYRLSGEIELESSGLLLSERGVEGRAEVNWTQAGSALSDVYPLGNYRIQLEGAWPVLNLELSTQSGKLLLSGRGRLEQGKGLAFNGTAQAAKGEQQEGLSELLHHIGPESAPGVFTLAFGTAAI